MVNGLRSRLVYSTRKRGILHDFGYLHSSRNRSAISLISGFLLSFRRDLLPIMSSVVTIVYLLPHTTSRFVDKFNRQLHVDKDMKYNLSDNDFCRNSLIKWWQKGEINLIYSELVYGEPLKVGENRFFFGFNIERTQFRTKISNKTCRSFLNEYSDIRCVYCT